MTGDEKWEALRAYNDRRIEWCAARMESDEFMMFPVSIRDHIVAKHVSAVATKKKMEELDNV